MPEHSKQTVRRRVRFPDELKKRCMLLLQLRHDRFRDDLDAQIICAALLGRALKHWPNVKRETLRRSVRALVNEMRHEGAPIASGNGGYWIAKTVEDFQVTEAFLRRHGIAELATNAKIKQSAAAARAVGQTRLPAYHALVTGRDALSLYLTPKPPADVDDPPSASPTAEQSGQPWSDSLFAFA